MSDEVKRPERKKATLKYAVDSKCAECMGYWVDGKVDCEVTNCSLYPWQPYRKLEPDLDWTRYSPRRQGKILWVDIPKLESKGNCEALKAYHAKKAKENKPI